MKMCVSSGHCTGLRLLQGSKGRDGWGRCGPATPGPAAASSGLQSGITGTQYPSSSILLPPTHMAAPSSSCLGRWGVEELHPGWEGWGGLTEQVQEAMSYPDCPWSLTCGLAMVKSALLTCHLESHRTPILGAGCVAHCSLKEKSPCGWVTKGNLKECPY